MAETKLENAVLSPGMLEGLELEAPDWELLVKDPWYAQSYVSGLLAAAKTWRDDAMNPKHEVLA